MNVRLLILKIQWGFGNFCSSEIWGRSREQCQSFSECIYHSCARDANSLKGQIIYRNVTLGVTTIHHFFFRKIKSNQFKTKQNKSYTFQFCSHNVSKGHFLRRKEKSIGIYSAVCESQSPVFPQLNTISQCPAMDICHCHSHEALQIETYSRILQEIDFNSTRGNLCNLFPHSAGPEAIGSQRVGQVNRRSGSPIA